MDVSPRLTRWIEQQFEVGAAEEVLEELRSLPASAFGRQDVERVQASLVIGGDGWEGFRRRRAALDRDWRDALVWGGLGNGDWPSRLDDVLGRDCAGGQTPK